MRMTNSLRAISVMVLLLTAAMLVAACSSEEAAAPAPSKPAQAAATATPIGAGYLATPTPVPVGEQVRPGGYATWGVRRDPPAAFDMMMTTIWYDLHQIAAGIWGSGNLVRPCLDDVYTPCPALATAWESNDDFTEWTFTLREGVTWHDGTPLTAEDLKFWLDLVFKGYNEGGNVRKPAWYSTSMGVYNRTDILDATHLKIVLDQGNPLFVQILFTPYYTIAHQRSRTQPELEAGNTTVAPLELDMMGLGPFDFDIYKKGSVARVVKNEAYWEKDENGLSLPYLEGMDFAIMTSPDLMDAAIRTGRLDGGSPGFGYILTKPRYEAYKAHLGDDFYVVQVPSSFGAGGGSGLSFNVLKEGPWQDVRVRKAMSLWIDKQESIDAVTGGFGLVTGLLNPVNPFTNPDVLTWPGFNKDTKEADRAEAKKLMAEAGYPDGGFEMSYNCLTTGAWRDRCEFLAAQLAELGITLKLDLMDAPAWKEAAASLRYDAVQSAGGIVSPIPEANIPAYLPYSENPAGVSKHEDQHIADLLERLRISNDLDERISIWREFERYWLLEQVYAIPIAGNLATIPYRSWVKGRIAPREQIMAYQDFTTVWLDK